MKLFSFDDRYREQGCRIIAGIDEAGRGPWAGPVVAAAVVLPTDKIIPGINDSKKLTSLQRQKLYQHITSCALSIGIEIVDQQVIDSINILQATYRAMRGAFGRISIPVDIVLVDGSPVPALGPANVRQESIVGGDGKSAAIAAASIIAKVTRDTLMCDLSSRYPQYNFHQHKGYGTPDHYKALVKYGPCPIHRKSFAPIKELLKETGTADVQ